MKYPKLRAEWTPVENPSDFAGVRNQQVMRVYKIVPNDEVDSTATITFTDSPDVNGTIVIVDRAGTSGIYKSASSTNVSSGEFNHGGKENAAAGLKECIEYASGETITVVDDGDGSLTLTQKALGPITVANKVIVSDLSNVAIAGFDNNNEELVLEEEYPEWIESAEFFVPAWDSGGKLLVEPTEIMFTIQTFSPLEHDQVILEGDVDSFSSEIISSETIQLSSLSTDDPSNLEVFVMPFPENYQEYEIPVVPASGVF